MRRMVQVIGMVGVMMLEMGCGASKPTPFQMVMNERINAMEAGDSSLTCPQLEQEIAAVDEKIEILESGVNSMRSDNTFASLLGDMLVQTAYSQNQFSGMLQSAFQGKNRQDGQHRVAGAQEQLSSAQTRRNHLVAAYNQRCFH